MKITFIIHQRNWFLLSAGLRRTIDLHNNQYCEKIAESYNRCWSVITEYARTIHSRT